jgi:hypothetical protein
MVAETCFRLKRSGFGPALALQFIERNIGQLPVVLQNQINAVSRLFKHSEHVPCFTYRCLINTVSWERFGQLSLVGLPKLRANHQLQNKTQICFCPIATGN